MPLDETTLIKTTDSFNEILNDPLAVLYGLKEAYENYSRLNKKYYSWIKTKFCYEKIRPYHPVRNSNVRSGTDYDSCFNTG